MWKMAMTVAIMHLVLLFKDCVRESTSSLAAGSHAVAVILTLRLIGSEHRFGARDIEGAGGELESVLKGRGHLTE